MLHFSQRKPPYHSQFYHRFSAQFLLTVLACETQQLTIMHLWSKRRYYKLGVKTLFCADRMTKYDSNFGIEILSNCSQTTQKLGLYVLPNPVYHMLSTALRIINLVTDCRRYNWRCDGANCRERRCRKRSSGNSTFGSHWSCWCSGRERDSWCSLRLRGQSRRHRSGLCKPKLLKRLTTVRCSHNQFRIKDIIHLL